MSEAKEGSSYGRLREKILIVDDDPGVLKALQRILRPEGYELLLAETAQEALQFVRNEELSVIICDQHLPDRNGVSVLAVAQELQPNTGRICMTGSHDLETIIEAINVGQISHFIHKPWDPQGFIQTVRDGVTRYRLQRDNALLQERILDQHRQLQSNHASVQKELQLGGRIHSVMLRSQKPSNVPGMLLEVETEPSKEVDGDFYDFYQPNEAIFDIVMGDVMGKGIPAALVGAAMKAHLRRFAVPSRRTQLLENGGAWQDDLAGPSEILMRVEEEVGQQLTDLDFFTTLFYGRFHLDQSRLSFVDCGSTKPLHYNPRTGTAEFLEGENFPVGAAPNGNFAQIDRHYEEGDLFIFYSDGLTEARSPDGLLFGEQRLVDFVKANGSLPPRAMMHMLKNSVACHTQQAEFEDDLTVIILQVSRVGVVDSSVTHETRLKACLSQLPATRQMVADLCSRIPGDAEMLSQQLQLVVNEAFVNAVEHGGASELILRGERLTDGIAIEIADDGTPFDPSSIQTLDLSGEQDGGYGLMLMRELSDRMSYQERSTEGRYNYLQLFKSYLVEEEAMEYSHKKTDNVLVISLQGDNLDARDAPAFKESVTGLIQSEQAPSVVFDMQSLTFIDSSGLGALLSVLRQLHTTGGDLKLANMTKPIRTMFEVVRMHKLFEIYPSTEDAVRSFEVAER